MPEHVKLKIMLFFAKHSVPKLIDQERKKKEAEKRGA